MSASLCFAGFIILLYSAPVRSSNTSTTVDYSTTVTTNQTDTTGDGFLTKVKFFFTKYGNNLLWGLAGFLTATIFFSFCHCVSKWREAKSGHIVPVAETQPITKDKEKTKPQNVVKEKVKVKRPPAAPPNKVSKNPKVQNPHNKPTEEESQKPYAYCEHKIDKPENPKLTNTCQGSKRESYDIVDFNRVPSDDNIASSDAEENFYDIGLQKMSRKQSTKDPDYSTVNLKMGENVTTQPTDANAKGSIEANIEDSGLSIYDDIGEAIAQTTDTVNSEKQHEHKAIGDETKEKKTGNHFEADNNAEDDINKFLYDEVDEKVTDKTFVCNVEQMTDNFDHSATPSVDNDKKSYHHSAEEAENGIPLAQNDDNEGNTDDIVKRSFVSTECTDFWDTEILKDTDSGISGSEVESKDSTMLSSTVINMFYEELQGLDIN